jgi:hypothetical protein
LLCILFYLFYFSEFQKMEPTENSIIAIISNPIELKDSAFDHLSGHTKDTSNEQSKDLSKDQSKDQIFRKHPTDEIIEKLLGVFGLKDLDDQKTFSRNDLRVIKTVERLNFIKPELEAFYIPCKARTYLSYIDEKTAITILRQFVKTRNRMIESREKYMKGSKFLIYYIVQSYNRPYNPVAWKEPVTPALRDTDENDSAVTLHFD